MKQQKISALLTVIGFLAGAVTSNAAPTEVSANLLSTIQRQANGNASDTFSVSFGALNGGLFALTTKNSSADSADGFALWYGNNSRTLLSWGSPVQGSLITDSDDFYQYWGSDSSVTARKGAALTSIFDAALDNRALAFVTYSSGGTVQEVGLYDLGFTYADPAAAALGTFDFLTLSSDVTAIYGATSPSTGTYGSISTSNVPEPSSSLLLLVGGLALAGVRQFRKKI